MKLWSPPHHMLQAVGLIHLRDSWNFRLHCMACLNQMTNRASTPITANHAMPIRTQRLVCPPCLIWRSWSCLPCLFSSGSSHQGNKGLWCKAPTGSSHHGSEPNHMRKKEASANQPPVHLALRHMASTALCFISEWYGTEPCHWSSAAKCKVASDGFRLRSMGRQII